MKKNLNFSFQGGRDLKGKKTSRPDLRGPIKQLSVQPFIFSWLLFAILPKTTFVIITD